MGVPAFFRWLSRKYVSIIVDAVEERRKDEEGVKMPVDCTQPNPNYQEFDNLYLDMNGIIHPCTHPEDRPAPKTEEEMFILIFEYIDRLFSIVRPRKLLYMAIDGVAPRAKMNQQRSRRFRASKEAADKREQIATIRKRLEAEGTPLPPARKEEEHFDSNCITPGTPFMARLSDALRYYIHMRITNDAAWKKIQVILSDANAPGEGEHKIMDFIRRQRASSSHDPNTVHCLCGADADLIMLGLATHESNFNILREEFVPNQPKACELCGQYGHELEHCQGLARAEAGPDQADPLKKEKNFIFIRLPVLREYLERELTMPNLPFPYDLERAIDDWVMMCFFVGNDFLPHLPSLEIREGAIDRLVKLYKQMVYQTGGWLTEDGEVNIERVTMIMTELGKAEDKIFKERQMYELKFKESQKLQKRRSSYNASLATDDPQQISQLATEQPSLLTTTVNKNNSYVSFGSKRKADTSIDVSPNGKPPTKLVKEDESDDEPKDGIRFWEAGWKDRYYRAKFQVSESDHEFRRKVACAYLEGIAWMFRYYRKGCATWTWYYPFHYAPFASDFELVGNFKPDFSKATKPFKPLEQMMGVFPAASRLHIPAGWRSLMIEPNSSIIDFYPEHFEIDMDGKKFASQGIALLPFVDEKRLLDALTLVYDTLTPEEQARNMTGPDRLFVGKQHNLFNFVHKVHMQGKRNGRIALAVNNTNRMESQLTKINSETDKNRISEIMEHWTPIDTHKAFGMSGEICHDKKAMECGISYVFMFQNSHFGELKNNQCIMVRYRNPQTHQQTSTDQETTTENKDAPHLMKPRSQAHFIAAEDNNSSDRKKCDNASLSAQISLKSFAH